MSTHLTMLSFVLLASFALGAQVPFSYNDIHGNQFSVSSSKDIFARFDTAFFASNLTGKRLQLGTDGDTIRFLVKIVEIKKVNRYNFKIRLQKQPLTSNATIISKYMGYYYYQMKVSSIKGKPYFDKIEFVEFEI